MRHTDLSSLLQELLALPKETEWVEFKHNKADPQQIGEYLSALSNSAALHGKTSAYIVWGIDDTTRRVVGTDFKPRQAKRGNEDLESWLAHSLVPRIDFKIHEFAANSCPMVLFEIQPATGRPVRFKDREFIRIGSYKKKLQDFPEKERALWSLFSQTPFEKGIALGAASSDDVLALINYPAFFELTKQRLPENRTGILDRLTREKIILKKGQERYDITNLGDRPSKF